MAVHHQDILSPALCEKSRCWNTCLLQRSFIMQSGSTLMADSLISWKIRIFVLVEERDRIQIFQEELYGKVKEWAETWGPVADPDTRHMRKCEYQILNPFVNPEKIYWNHWWKVNDQLRAFYVVVIICLTFEVLFLSLIIFHMIFLWQLRWGHFKMFLLIAPRSDS